MVKRFTVKRKDDLGAQEDSPLESEMQRTDLGRRENVDLEKEVAKTKELMKRKPLPFGQEMDESPREPQPLSVAQKNAPIRKISEEQEMDISPMEGEMTKGSAIRSAGEFVRSAGAGFVQGTPMRAIPKIAQYTVKPFTKWFGGAVAESLKAKTLETLALVIVAIILGAFGFIFAAIGVVFFIAFLYLPGEAEILARAREQGRNLPVNQLIDILDEIQLTLADMKATKDKREKAELRGKLKDLLEKRKYIIKKAVDSGVSPQQLKDIAEISKTFPAEAGE